MRTADTKKKKKNSAKSIPTSKMQADSDTEKFYCSFMRVPDSQYNIYMYCSNVFHLHDTSNIYRLFIPIFTTNNIYFLENNKIVGKLNDQN